MAFKDLNKKEEHNIKIEVEDREGRIHFLEGPTDMNLNLMEICKANELPVEGVCGGMALCASCHVYIQSDHPLEIPSLQEEDMLDQAFYVESNSRLCCQIPLSDKINGIKIKLAPV